MEGCFAEVFELRFPKEVVGEEVVGDVEEDFLRQGDECWFWWGEKSLHGWFLSLVIYEGLLWTGFGVVVKKVSCVGFGKCTTSGFRA